MTSRPNSTTRRLQPSSKDSDMHQIDLRLAAIQEYHELLRLHSEADRAVPVSAHSIRSRLGELLIRLGRRVAGESLTAPAWTG
jgi:hypothetical protein